MYNEKKWDKFITENRAEIDEFLGPNNPVYTAIALKGQLMINLGKERATNYFEALMNSEMTQLEQNNYLRKLLVECRENLQNPPDPLMRFGIDSKLLLGEDKQEFMKIMGAEFLGKCPASDVYCIYSKKCNEVVYNG